MNILPKKRWHVRTRENIERVRRDEEKAAEEEKEIQRRIALAEQEARTDLLRKRSQKRLKGTFAEDAGEQQLELYNKNQHVNLFQNLEDGEKTKKGNKEYEEEKKEEREKYEKSIGLLTYLGQSAIESQTSKPWYFKPPGKKIKNEAAGSNSNQTERFEFEMKKKSSMDPMRDMIKYLEHKKKKKKKDKEREKEFERKYKHKDKYRYKEESKKKSNSSQEKKTIEQLRAERLRREQEEREKTRQLLAKMRGEKIQEKEETVTDERQMRYNSQFNPELVRVRKRKYREDFDH